MKKMKRYIPCLLLLLACLMAGSCKKEIDIDYPSTAPLPVIEGSVSNEGMEVSITYTRDVTDSVKTKGVGGALVVVTSSDGTSETLAYDGVTGKYRSEAKGKPGLTYTLEVTLNGRHYKAVSTMHEGFEVLDEGFMWWTVLDNRMVIYELLMSHGQEQPNYYCYRMFRNGKMYRWQASDSRGRINSMIPVTVMCMSEKMAEENDEEDRESILYEGDEIEMQILSIDRTTFDYLKSLAASGRTTANPYRNFEGDECLGYFSAHSIRRIHRTFSYKDMKDYNDTPNSLMNITD